MGVSLIVIKKAIQMNLKGTLDGVVAFWWLAADRPFSDLAIAADPGGP